MSVAVSSDSIPLPEVVMDVGDYVPAPPQIGLPNYGVFPDGRTFVMIQREQLGPAPQLRVVLNWVAGLEPLAPAN